MKKGVIISIFLIICNIGQILAQNQERVTDLSEFEKELSISSKKIKSLKGDFTQEKYVDLLKDKIISTGKLYYLQGNKLRMEYFTPMKYEMVFNGNLIMINSNGKSNVIDMSGNPMADKMNKMIEAAVTGDILTIAQGFAIELYKDATSYLLKVKEKEKGAASGYFKELEIRLDRKSMMILSLKLYEGVKDYTLYKFTNTQINSTLDEALFKIR